MSPCARAEGRAGGEEEKGAGMMQCLATGICARARAGDYKGGGSRGWGRGEEGGRQLPVPNGPNGYQLWSPLSCGVKAHCSLSL